MRMLKIKILSHKFKYNYLTRYVFELNTRKELNISYSLFSII